MKRRVAFVVLWAVTVAVPVTAQNVSIPCGGIVSVQNQSAQFGSNLWLVYSVSTAVPPNVCVFSVAAEAHVAGKSGTDLYREGTWSATAQR